MKRHILLDWDERKNRENQKRHGISFEQAALVFEDPDCYMFENDFVRGEQRWCTVGMIGTDFVAVFHLYAQEGDQEFARLISARQADPHEIRRYHFRNEAK
jgi:uncharacterized protein